MTDSQKLFDPYAEEVLRLASATSTTEERYYPAIKGLLTRILDGTEAVVMEPGYGFEILRQHLTVASLQRLNQIIRCFFGLFFSRSGSGTKQAGKGEGERSPEGGPGGRE